MSVSSPTIDEIRRLHHEAQTGLLILTHKGGERLEMFFREGMIEAASSTLRGYRLGDFLAKIQSIPTRELDAAASEARRQNVHFGEALVRAKLLSPALVGAAARRQATELVEHALNTDFRVDSFSNCLRSYYVSAGVSFPQLMLELSRAGSPPLKTGDGTLISLSGSTDLSGFHWSPQELNVLTELRQPNTVGSLLASTNLDRSSLAKILGVLHGLELIEMQDTSPLGASINIVPTGGAQDGGSLAARTSFAFDKLTPVVTNAVLNEKLLVARQECSFVSEQFKNLKVRLTEPNSTSPLKVFTVSSADAQDGKSLVSAALAFSFAMDPGRRVIIVDCDLRRPGLEEYLGVTSEPGLLQYLASAGLRPYCYIRRIANLYFMTAGGVAPNAIEILSMRKMRQLIESLQKEFDTIILDAPPYSPIADARVVTGLSDGLIMVIRRGRTSYSSADRAFNAVDRNKLLGVVFNDVKPMPFHTYSDFGYYRYGKKHPELPADGAIPRIISKRSKRYIS
jgi:capsular exopolysaccharide synthesis family protein